MDINKKSKQHIFDSYCKTILRNEARDYYEHLKLRRQNEISLSDLSEKDLEKLSVMPNHFATIITSEILGLDIIINDLDVAEALMMLSKEKREIILLYYFLDMNDREIAEEFNFIRKTINNHRRKILGELKIILKEKRDE